MSRYAGYDDTGALSLLIDPEKDPGVLACILRMAKPGERRMIAEKAAGRIDGKWVTAWCAFADALFRGGDTSLWDAMRQRLEKNIPGEVSPEELNAMAARELLLRMNYAVLSARNERQRAAALDRYAGRFTDMKKQATAGEAARLTAFALGLGMGKVLSPEEVQRLLGPLNEQRSLFASLPPADLKGIEARKALWMQSSMTAQEAEREIMNTLNSIGIAVGGAQASPLNLGKSQLLPFEDRESTAIALQLWLDRLALRQDDLVTREKLNDGLKMGTVEAVRAVLSAS